MEATPNLRLVDAATGEVLDECPGCARLSGTVEDLTLTNEQLGSTISGQALQIARLKAEVRDLHAAEPEEQAVRRVLAHWAQRVVAEGWWSRPPRYRPGCPRWTAARARMKDGYEDTELMEATEGSLIPQKGNRVKREWLDATSIFRNGTNLERNRERFRDPENANVREVLSLPDELRQSDLWLLAEPCDCGHLRMHHLALPETEGRELCRNCDCGGFTNYGRTWNQ